MASYTSVTVTGSIQTRRKTDRVTGASYTEVNILVPFLEMSDNSITPKENDYITDGSDSYLITGIRQDPLQALYTFQVRKL